MQGGCKLRILYFAAGTSFCNRNCETILSSCFLPSCCRSWLVTTFPSCLILMSKVKKMGISYVVEHETNKTFFTFFSEFDRAWKDSHILVNIILGFLFVMSLGGNTLVISFFVRFKAIRQVTNLFITNLAVSNLTFSILVPLVMTTQVTGDWVVGDALCHLATAIEFMSGIVCAWTMVLISVDRYQTIVKLPGRRSTLKGTLVRVVLVWIGAIFFTSPLAVFFRTVESAIKDKSKNVLRRVIVCSVDAPGPHYMLLIYACINIFLVFIIPLTIITRNYRAIMKKFSSSVQRMRNHMESAPRTRISSVRAAAHVHKEARVLRMLIAMVVLFVLMWGPVTVFILAYTADYENQIIQSYQLTTVFIITYANAALNPVVYGILNEQYQSQFRRLFNRIRCKVTLCDTSVRENGSTVGRNSIRQVIRTLSGREIQNKRYDNGDGFCENVMDNICEETQS
ncbi:neuropeptide Y receptor type 2-like [Acanthaster planci]|uniref:Neuropeptide Y receptor type 2-like n=1 Tax=Acanthaster planci TaxID=133434 RepID=A0A8B7XL35_ACAPL|nr:neuropeptide Y receptor type 2-like [Acanthaster planci]